MAEANPLEAFRLALAGATRAIAGDAEVELSFIAVTLGDAQHLVERQLPALFT